MDEPIVSSVVNGNLEGASHVKSRFDEILLRLAREHEREVQQLTQALKLHGIQFPTAGSYQPSVRASLKKSAINVAQPPETPREVHPMVISDERFDSHPEGDEACTISITSVLSDPEDKHEGVRSLEVHDSRRIQSFSMSKGGKARAVDFGGSSQHTFEKRSISTNSAKSEEVSRAPSMVTHGSAQPALQRWRHLINITQANLVKLRPIWREANEVLNLHAISVSTPQTTGDSHDHNPAEQSMHIWSTMGGRMSRFHRNLGSFDPHMPQELNNAIARCGNFKKENIVLHPNSRHRVLWDLCGMILLTFDMITIPMTVFDAGTDGLGDGFTRVQQRVDMGATIFWTLDMGVSFITGYYSDEGFVELRHSRIARHYAQTWMSLDAFIVVMDWTNVVLDLNSEIGYLRLGKTASRFMRVLRLLRFMKLNRAFQELMERINSEYLLTMVGILKLLLMIVIVNHYIACGWYGLSQIEHGKDTWAQIALEQTGKDSWTFAYTTSLHWSLTQFTPASMEVMPQNAYERLYTIVVIVGAMVTFSSFVSSITGAMTHMRSINAKKVEADASIRSYFMEQKISQDLASRVWHFRRRNTQACVRKIKESDIPALKGLPESIREELRVEVFAPTLSHHPLFNMYLDLEPDAMRRLCNTGLQEKFMMTSEELPLEEPIRRMLFVCTGRLEYNPGGQPKRVSRRSQVKKKGRATSWRTTRVSTPSQEHKPEGVVNAGQWACEIAIWSSMAKLAVPFCSGEQSGCELVMLHAEVFQGIAKVYPDNLGFLSKYAELFVMKFNACTQDPMFANILFNDAAMLQGLVQASLDAQQRNGKRDSLNKESIFRTFLALKNTESGPKQHRQGMVLNDSE